MKRKASQNGKRPSFVSTKGVKYRPLSTSSAVIWEKKGQSLEGRYLGSRKTTYENREVLIHQVATDPNTVVDVWESSALKNLRLLPKGAAFRITYKGMRKSKKGRRSYKDFEIQVEEGVDIDLSAGTPF